MVGGEYTTWFTDKGAKERKILYFLEEKCITRVNQEKIKSWGYRYEWVMTEKGKKLFGDNKELMQLFKQGKILEFYQRIKEFL